MVLSKHKTLDIHRLLTAHIEGKSPRTVRAYQGDIREFMYFHGFEAPIDLTGVLLSDPDLADRMTRAYLDRLKARGLARSTINRKLSAIRALTSTAWDMGLITWRLGVPNVK